VSVVEPTDAALPRVRGGRTSRLTVVLAVGLTLLIGLAATIAAMGLDASDERAARAELLQSLTDDSVSRITTDVHRYADLLGALAAFQTESDRSMRGYEAYVAQLDVSRFAGVWNTTFVEHVRSEDLDGLIAARRADGQPTFDLESTYPGTEHAIVAYAAPTPSAAPGYDLMSDPTRRRALEFAADTGRPALTGAVTPLEDRHLPPSEQGTRLVAVMAVYAPGSPVTTVGQRRLALLGWTYISLELGEIMTSLDLADGRLDVALLIDDEAGDGSTAMAESRPGAAARLVRLTGATSTTIAVGGREIEVRVAFAGGRAPKTVTAMIAFVGALISLLAAYGVYATLRYRRGLLNQAEAERRRAELLSSRFHAAVDLAPVGVTVVSLDGKVELFNERLAELLQVSDTDDRSVASYYLPEDLSELAERFGQLTRGEVDRMVAERRLVRRDGSQVWCRITSSPLVGPDGEPTAIVAHIENIEAERAAVEELRSRSRWFSSIVERSSDLIGLLDRDGVVTWASPSTREILGNPPEMIVGLSVGDLVLPEDRDRVVEAVQLVQTGVQVRIEYRVRTLAGKVIWLETTANSLLDDPDVASIITFSRDVTERHRTDELMAHRAAHDALTGLLNRSELVITLEAALSDMRSSGEPLTVAFLDLDGFKAVNDDHGHAVGDQVLRVVADVLIDEVRSNDAIARLGGDEFVVVLRGAGLPAALQISDRVRRRLHEPMVLDGASGPVELSISTGLAAASYADTVDSLLHEADVALYEAKRRGRDRVEISSHGLAELGLDRDELLQTVSSDLD
jgi:diguanylate cyclase (GGDEF)-like protein/PAS domain S-box-containing protein